MKIVTNAEFVKFTGYIEQIGRIGLMSLLNRLNYYLWYLRKPPWDSGISPPELLEFIKGQPVGRALDVGCGTGTNVITLSRLGWRVCGVDFVPQAIARARKKCLQAGVSAEFKLGDITKAGAIGGRYELVLDLGCYHGLLNKEKASYLRQLDKVMLPGSRWFLYAFLRDEENVSSSGLSDSDLEIIADRFTLCSRVNGFDRGIRRSAYFIFEKP